VTSGDKPLGKIASYESRAPGHQYLQSWLTWLSLVSEATRCYYLCRGVAASRKPIEQYTPEQLAMVSAVDAVLAAGGVTRTG